MVDSVLVNTPISSPLHPQLNLPLLKSYLVSNGFSSKVIDANICFFHEFLGDFPRLGADEAEKNPLSLLSYYNDLESRLFDKCKGWEGLQVGLRSLGMKNDRVFFDSVVESVHDTASNPFIPFWDQLIDRDIVSSGARIVGIAITFQDQIIPAFTLAQRLRVKMPEARIVMGGQIITRCHDSMSGHKDIMALVDYMALWDGEEPLLSIHKRVLRNDVTADFTNVIDVGAAEHKIDRNAATPALGIPSPDFSDLDFADYLLPELLVPLQTTRGCYAACAFCAIPFGSNKYQVRTAETIVDEIVAIQEQTLRQTGRKAVYFKFMEDTSSPSVLQQLSALIKERGINAKWETFARLEKAFSRPGFMKELYEGGCRKIHWGLESNDPDILSRMSKKTEMSYTNEVMRLSAEAGIMNFCFILVGFPGETDAERDRLASYICENRDIHTLTIATFDLTRKSPMEQKFTEDNIYGLQMVPATDFQVRLPYLVNGENWKSQIIPAAHKMMIRIVRERPDIGFVTLFPDQIRAMFTDKYGCDWGAKFVDKYGADNILAMLGDTERYARDYQDKREIDPTALPEPLKREHLRTKEDMAILAKAIASRQLYEQRRINQV